MDTKLLVGRKRLEEIRIKEAPLECIHTRAGLLSSLDFLGYNVYMKKKKIIIGNWKMEPQSVEDAISLTTELKDSLKGFNKNQVVICPPFTFLPEVSNILGKSKNILLGAQDVGSEKGGAYTGEISADMLTDSGCKYVIVGHSERKVKGETDEIVSEKIYLATKAGLETILCVGEKIRDEHGQFWHELKDQLTVVLMKINRPLLKKVIVAYEPVWAIGKSEAMSSSELHETVIFIRKVLSDLYGRDSADAVQIIYGGSVDVKNAQELVEKGMVEGLLVGRESLKPKEFVKIVCSI